MKTLSDSGHGSDGSAEISTENSEDEEKCSAKVRNNFAPAYVRFKNAAPFHPLFQSKND